MKEVYSYSIIFSGWMVFLLNVLLFTVPDPFLYPFTYSDGTQYLRGGGTWPKP